MNSKRTSHGTVRQRKGIALLAALFIVSIMTVFVTNVFRTETLSIASHRNVIDYDRALYLAGSGVHHALAEISVDSNWRGSVSEGVFPLDGTYTATAADTPEGVLISSSGAAGAVQRNVQVLLGE